MTKEDATVTEKQARAYELRAQGKTWAEIGAAMGCHVNTARDRVLGAVKRGLKPILTERLFKPALRPGEPNRVERMKDGEGMFSGVAPMAGPHKDAPAFDPRAFVEMAASAGIPPRIANAIARRVAMQFGAVQEEFKRITAAQEVIELEKVRQTMLKYMDEVAFAGANIKDLAIAYGIIVDKSLLLGGKPTQIYDFNLRAKIEVLMPQFMAEAKRRGITVDGTAALVQEDGK